MTAELRNSILRIYNAVANDGLWPDILQDFAGQIGAVGCIIFEWRGMPHARRMTAPISSSYYDPEAINTYIRKCFQHEAEDHDKFEAHSLVSDGIDLIEDDVIAASDAQLRKRPNVATLEKLGIFHRAAGLLNKDNTAISRFSIQLPLGRGRLTPEEQAHIREVLPHIAKAMDLSRPAVQIAREHGALMAAMDRLVIGVCVLDKQGNVVVKNEEFERQLDSYRLFRIRPEGRLEMANRLDQKFFEDLKSDALNHGRFGARPRKEAVSTRSGSFLCIEVTPLQRSEELSGKDFGGYLVYSTDASRGISCDPLPMKFAYGLTEAELAIVSGIADGLTNAQIAERRDRAVTTINAQVKSILSKTHCSTRTQLVRLLLSFGADYLRPT